MPDHTKREVLPDGRVRFASPDCSFVFQSVRPGVLLVVVSGRDTGQFGTGPLDEIRLELLRHRPLEVFVDAREASGVAVKVSDEWTRFFTLNQEQLQRVNVLVASRVIELTVSIAQHLSRTGNLIRIFSDPDRFEERLSARVGERSS
jgi:hypothetical protein